jgi:HK97 family phage portal protein
MSIFQKIAARLGYEKRAMTGDPYWDNFKALRTGPVNPTTAQSVSSVYACVSAISETIASLPLILFRRNGEDRDRAADHPLYRVLHDQANEDQTAVEFREWMQASALLRGNGYAEIITGRDGQVRQLLPMPAERVTPLLKDGRLFAYDFVGNNGRLRRLLAYEVFRLRHRADDSGLVGVSAIQAAKAVIELALQERDHGIYTFQNGTRFFGVMTHPGKLGEKGIQNIRGSIDREHKGVEKTGKTLILEEGLKYQPISMTLEDAEWIAARQFSVEEVCRLFRVPPTIVGDLRHGNYSNSVELARQFVTMTLRRHLVEWEQAISKYLLTEAGQRIYYAEHQVEGLLRGDATNRADFYQKGIESGWLLRSEARRLENLPKIEGIDGAPADA